MITIYFCKLDFIFPVFIFRKLLNAILLSIIHVGAKGDWEFRISDLVKNPDGTDI